MRLRRKVIRVVDVDEARSIILRHYKGAAIDRDLSSRTYPWCNLHIERVPTKLFLFLSSLYLFFFLPFLLVGKTPKYRNTGTVECRIICFFVARNFEDMPSLDISL